VIAGNDGIGAADFDSGMTGRSWRPLVERGLVEFKRATSPATFVITTAGDDTYEVTLTLDRPVVQDLRSLYLSQMIAKAR
jgi:hypothetical protein